jgi:tRNA pseudouridine38-40 synthase
VAAHFRLVLEYDGTGFAGWQVQAGGERTVQGVLADAVRRACGVEPEVVGAGRTDAGVHALGQVAGVRVETRLAPPEFARALNALLPSDVAVRAAEAAPAGWHPRFDARAKRYRYAIWNGRARSPVRARFAYWVPRPLDVGAMATAAPALVGCRDFRCFQASGSGVEQTVRTLASVSVEGRPGGDVRVEVVGDGFLRHMVRNVVGTLLQVGLGERPADSLTGLLEARDRRLAGPTAPACGLTLVAVRYDEGFPRNPEELPPRALDAANPLG